jgi:hypothetical protein
LIEEGSAALRAGDAAAARGVFEAALAEAESGEVLEGLAEALYLDREYAASAAHYERAYAAHRRERQRMAASRAARTVAWITGNIFGQWAVQSGWWARAILEEAGEDGSERGWVLIIRSFSEPDPRAREALLRDAVAHGNQEAMDGFARVIAGVTSPAEFFSEQSVGRILGQAASASGRGG